MRSTQLLYALLSLSLMAAPGLGQSGLLAHFPCDEGSGNVTKDAVGGLTATLHGATWVKSGEGHCLKFDGEGAYVECPPAPALSPQEDISLAVWVRPEKIPAVGEPGIVGKAYHNYVLTYYGDGKVWWYAGASTVNVKAPVAPGAWHFVVGTCEKGRMRLYVDGELAGSMQGKAGKIPATESFFFGTSRGDPQWTKHKTFCGMIDEVRLYDRALTAQEVRQAYLTTNLTHQVEMTAVAAYAARQVIVRLDVRGLGEIPGDAAVEVSLAVPHGKRAVATRRLRDLAGALKMTTTLDAAKLKPGTYELWARAVAGKRLLGLPATVAVTWPQPPKWAATDSHIKVLNNFVSELRSVSNISKDTRVRFTNPREGWVYFQVTGKGGKGSVEATVPDCGETATLFKLDLAGGSPAEAMRRLPAGPHDLTIRCQDGGKAARVVVRSIPEIGYCRVDCGPQLKPYGPADWPFLEKYILPHINLAVSRGNETERERWAEWKRQGKRWIVETPLPGIGKKEGVSPDEVFAAWEKNGKVAEPLLDGMIVDEFGAGDDPIWQSWHAGLRRLRDDPRFKD
ncbi:MAG: LamG domain-containing protein, partial [Armatimonadetes bacterium]|nr:LamG domain-containing protein [Armatimonadota bacterium]